MTPIIPPAQLTLPQAASLLQSQGGTLTAQVSVTRKDTGKVEHHTLILTPLPAPQGEMK